MPVILTDLGKPDSLPVQFEDGPLLGNLTYTIDPNKIDLREEVIANNPGPTQQAYRVVAIDPGIVLLDFVRTE